MHSHWMLTDQTVEGNLDHQEQHAYVNEKLSIQIFLSSPMEIFSINTWNLLIEIIIQNHFFSFVDSIFLVI